MLKYRYKDSFKDFFRYNEDVVIFDFYIALIISALILIIFTPPRPYKEVQTELLRIYVGEDEYMTTEYVTPRQKIGTQEKSDLDALNVTVGDENKAIFKQYENGEYSYYPKGYIVTKEFYAKIYGEQEAREGW